ncbi:MAG TPA: hypothetical protein PKN95_02875 [Verrucomicrobiota bacterium]|nr:hypothetical protein [Verrucomicrobiota bacterium]HNT13255.1 hypothetical protein [Verrucomicrobiota bacterium]
MKSDPVYQQLQETLWRRPLTAQEAAARRAYLAQHPELQADAAAEAALSAILAQQPSAAMPSNFTARVLRVVAAERQSSPPGWRSAWRRWRPRLAIAATVLATGWVVQQQRLKHQQQALALAAQEMIRTPALTDPQTLADFEIIRQLPQPTVVADEKLLALSDELLALTP